LARRYYFSDAIFDFLARMRGGAEVDERGQWKRRAKVPFRKNNFFLKLPTFTYI
jgi:hypothetical protein